ncbi:hypothetical protein Cs7R123_62570 [Catellatospora sp. TT07R-123]|uniref:hypothetical protein n=1 Tax=Catellatospora sp. TT07R-123 TaxID=2733863 RepID=UPI001B24582A|nr:hypothetical protein [Catellatospora sp. TT07R-123]GHJ48915.1 hypothetical protein Cs7R123_62570 [Catellatospora sp. TT07R-123]
MTDPTTEGYTVAPEEVEAMVRNLCAYALGEPDPMQRYEDLTYQQVLFDGIAAALRRERGRALADLLVSGMPVAEVAAKTHLAAEARVRKLISLAGETERVKAAARPPAPAKAVKAAKAKEQPVDETTASPVPATDKRMLTSAERIALGLPADGPIPRAEPAKPAKPVRRRRAAA